MRLYSLSYSEFRDQPYLWVLENLTLININLIVGKNAVGKSRLLKIINGIARLIDGEIQPIRLMTGQYKAVFKDDLKESNNSISLKPDITFEIEIHNTKVVSERLIVGDDIKLDRKAGGRATIHFADIKGVPGDIDIQIPESNLAIVVRRDAKQHNFFEELHEWASTCWFFEFANQMQSSFTAIDKNIKGDISNFGLLRHNIHIQLKLGKERFGHDLIGSVIRDMRKVGYEIADFGLMPAVGLPNLIGNSEVPQCIYVNEVGIDKKLPQSELSSGMFRTLTLLIQLHLIRLGKKRGCFVIDDIGEGLDFERATKLISILITEAEKGFLQLIMSTNDRFVMNNVPLEYWCVLQREKGNVRAFNPRNSYKTFKEFEEHGFNNFDFFAKGFFSKNILDVKK